MKIFGAKKAGANSRQIFWTISALLVFSLIALRGIIFSGRLVGHNWDWLVPYFSEYLRHKASTCFFSWSASSVGGINDSALPVCLLKIPFYSLGYLNISGIFVAKALLLSTIIVAGVSMYLLMKETLGKLNHKNTNFIYCEATNFVYFVSFLSAFFYAFSPFLHNEFIGGSDTQYFSYALFPLSLFFFRKSREKGVFVFLTAVVLSLITMSLQNFLLATILLWSWALFSSSRINFLKRLILIYGLYSLFNLYWIVPVIASYFFATLPIGAITPAELSSIANAGPSIIEVLEGVGYFRPFFLWLVHPAIKSLWHLVVFLMIIVVIFFANLFWGKARERFFWLIAFLASLVFATVSRPPFGNLVFWLYDNFFLMRLFRSFQHWMVFPTFCLAVLIGLGSFFLLLKLKELWGANKKVRWASFCLYFGLLIWLYPFFWYGDLGSSYLKSNFGAGNAIDLFEISPGYKKVVRNLLSFRADFRTLFLPMAGSPYYLATEYQSEAQGSDPLALSTSPFPVFAIDFTTGRVRELAEIMAENLYQGINSEVMVKMMGFFNIQNVVLRRDVKPNFGKSKDFWDYKRVIQSVNSNRDLIPVSKEDYVSLYSLDKSQILPHFYISENVIFSQSNLSGLIDMANFEDYRTRSAIYFADNAGSLQRGLINQVDEMFIKAVLENPVSEKELGEIAPELESVFFPYVRWKPGSLVYPLVLKKEQLDEWKERNNPEQLFEKKLFYAAKRISEIEKWELALGESDWQETIDKYEQKMEEVFQVLEQIKQGEKKSFFSLLAKLDTSLQAHQERLENLRLSEKREVQFENIFEKLEEKLNQIKIKHDFSQLSYKFDIPKEGEYEVFIKKVEIEKLGNWEIDGEEMIMEEMELREDGWINLGKRSFGEGEHKLVLRLPEAENLVSKNWQQFSDLQVGEDVLFFSPQLIFPGSSSVGFQEIRDYTPNTIFRLTFDYRVQNGKASFSVIQDMDRDEENGEINPLIMRTLRKTNDREFEHAEVFIKSSPFASLARFYLFAQPEEGKIADVAFENLKVERVLEPAVILRNLKLQTSNFKPQIPNITFAKVNPTKYRVKIEGTKGPYTLVFSESFHEGWKAYTQTSDIKPQTYNNIIASYFDGEIKEGTHKNIFLDRNTFETWGKKSIAEDRHLLVNGYANSWYITPQDSGRAEDYEIIIEFQPQKLFYLGLGVSFAALLGCFGYLGYAFFRRRIKE